MADFFARYSPAATGGGTVTANQGTSPWIVAGGGTAGTAATGVVTVQGIASGVAVPISGSVTATNASIAATGGAVPASTTYIGASVAGTMTGLVATTNGLKVDGSAVTQPVSGSLTVSGTVAATQSGTWNITNVSGTVSLPTGAATEASLVKIPVAQASTTSGQSGPLVQGAVTTAAPTYTTAQTSPLSLTTVGALRVDGSNVTQPVSGTVTANQGGSWTVSLPGTTAAFQAEGSVAFGSITSSYVTLFTPSTATKILQMRNNMNASVSVSFDAGTTLSYVLDAGDQVSLDFKSNGLLMSVTAIQVKYTVGAPTSGSFRINGCA